MIYGSLGLFFFFKDEAKGKPHDLNINCFKLKMPFKLDKLESKGFKKSKTTSVNTRVSILPDLFLQHNNFSR